MKFEEVLPALREGKKIRRKSWKREECFFVIKNGSLVDDHGYSAFFYLGGSLLEEDWEIVKEKKKVKLRDLTRKQYSRRLLNHCNSDCDHCLFKMVECTYTSQHCWFDNKDFYSDKFLDQEIEVKEDD